MLDHLKGPAIAVAGLAAYTAHLWLPEAIYGTLVIVIFVPAFILGVIGWVWVFDDWTRNGP